MANLKPLLDLIGWGEAGAKGYDSIYAGAKGIAKNAKKPTKMTVDQVIALQSKMVAAGSKSSAIGRYQFIRATLRYLDLQLGLEGHELFDAEMQDRLATQLLKNRGLLAFLGGALPSRVFANNLAREWASLPVATDCHGAHRALHAGESYYAGDGLNMARVKVSDVLAVLDGLRTSAPAPEPAPEPEPPAEPEKPDNEPSSEEPAKPEKTSFWKWLLNVLGFGGGGVYSGWASGMDWRAIAALASLAALGGAVIFVVIGYERREKLWKGIFG